MSLLAAYEEESGQLVNKAKSSFMIPDSASSLASSAIACHTGFSRKLLPFKYLGCMIFKGRKKREYFDHLITQLSDSLSGWKAKLLSFGARKVLIQSTLTAAPVYCFQAFLPVLDALSKICNRFLWGDRDNRRSYHWVSWSAAAKPVAEGGLGFRSFSEVCTVFSYKLWWKLRTEKSLWTSFMRQKYAGSKTHNSRHSEVLGHLGSDQGY